MRRLLSLLALTTACSNDYEVNAQQRILSTSYATFDASMVAVGDRETMSIYLTSTGQGPITVFDVEVDDPDHWTVTNSWALMDEDGNEESLAIDGGTDASPSYGMVEVIFKPDQEGQFRTVLTVTSNDNEVTETDDEGRGLWKVVLRGIGRYPCGNIYPTFHDFGSRAAGGYFAATTTLENCGGTILTIADFEPVGSPSFTVSTPTPIYVLPGQSEPVELAFEPAGGSPPAEAIISINGNDPDIADVYLTVIGNDCDKSTSGGWDADHDGWFSCAGDCDDNNAAVSPSAVERAANSIDDDCDGIIDEEPNSVSTDDDGDGFTETGGDCDDDDVAINPDALEVINQIDDDCDGHIDEDTDWADDDLDGFSERDGDCDDDDTLIYPGAEEKENEIDDDCDGQVDEGSNFFDDDFDGFAENDPSGVHDCDDDDPWTFPEAQEDCDDRDNDCDGDIDEGEDGSPNGACSFLVERQAKPKAKEKGCSATAASGGAVLATLALIGLAIRRRED